MAWCMMTDEEGTKVGDDNKKEGSHTEVTQRLGNISEVLIKGSSKTSAEMQR